MRSFAKLRKGQRMRQHRRVVGIAAEQPQENRSMLCSVQYQREYFNPLKAIIIESSSFHTGSILAAAANSIGSKIPSFPPKSWMKRRKKVPKLRTLLLPKKKNEARHKGRRISTCTNLHRLVLDDPCVVGNYAGLKFH